MSVDGGGVGVGDTGPVEHLRPQSVVVGAAPFGEPQVIRAQICADAVAAEEVGDGLLSLAARAQACGIDPDQALRDAIRVLERRVVEAESAAR